MRFQATPIELDYIQRVFNKANQLLADATDGHHRFGTINIVNNKGASESAEFYIVKIEERTSGPGGVARFGVHGLAGSLGYDEVFGRLARERPGSDFEITAGAFTLAHEFAHLAYDVSDEYSGPNVPRNANCAPGIGPGARPQDPPDLNYCLMDSYKTRGGMSVAQNARITLKEFCVASNHDKPNPDGRDDRTHQSIEHNNMSCWETIARLDKLWRLPAPVDLPNPVPPIAPPPINFGTSCGSQRVVLLIDRSGSMASDNRLKFAKLSASLFTTFYGGGAFLGVVSFANSATVNYPLTQINDTDNSIRNSVKSSINSLAANGATNLGGGLQAALDQLTGQGGCSSCGKTIILLSDGDHNTGVPPESVIPALQKAGVRVIAAVIGSSISLSGETSLKSIAEQTGGQYFRILSPTTQPIPETDSSNLQGLFLQLVNDIKGNGMQKKQRDSIVSGQVKEYSVLVEQDATSATFSIIKANEADNVTLSLRTPSGTVINESSGTNVEFISDSNSRSLKVMSPIAGSWSIVVSAGTVSTGKLEVLASAKHDAVRLNAWIENDTLVSPEAVKVHAAPIYEGVGVVGANVSGTVIHPDGSKMPVTLFDDGNFNVHGDITPNDGIYSVLFNAYSSDGTYTFELSAANSNGRIYEGEFSDLPSTRLVPPFSRVASATAIVTGLTQGDIVWVDDALPRGATPHGDGETWHWVDANPAPFMGGAAHQSKIVAGFHQHYFDGATAQLTINPGDKLFTYVFLDPDNMPKEIMLQWNDGDWEHRAYWGDNNVHWGIDGTQSRRRIGDLPKPGGWVRLEVDASLIGLEGRTISGMAFGVDGGRATWDRAGKGTQQSVAPSPEVVWVNDALPVGATPDVVDDVWNWVSSNPAPFNGQLAHRTYFGNSGDPVRFRAHSFSGASVPMSINPGDVLFAYVYLDPTYTPDEIILQWNDGDGWEYRAYWGGNFVDLGITGTESRRFMGALPPSGQWVRLEVPASYVGLEGKSVSGMSFGLYRNSGRGLATWDYAGKTSVLLTEPLPLHATTPFYRFFGTDYNGYYYYSTNDIGRADQAVQRIQCYIFPNQAAGTVPLYRFRNTAKRYFYTTNRNGPQPPVWEYEAIAGYVYPDGSTPGTVPLYIFRGQYDYFFTTTYSEGAGMTYEGISCYVNETQSLTPLAPSHLQVTQDPSGYLLTWRDNSSNETGFKIEHRELTDWVQITTVGANVSAFRIGTNAPTGFYRVKATNAAGDSAYSNEAHYVDEYPSPGGLIATVTTNATVFLTWIAPTPTPGGYQVDYYQVERSPSVNGPYTPLTPNPTTTSFTDGTASNGIAYLYRVRAFYTGGGYSNYSNKDLTTTVIFTDNPLVVGVTPIMAQHLTELREAVNAVRILAGIGQASWTYPNPVSDPPAQRRKIYLEDVTDLRSRLDEALTTLGMSQPYPTNPPLARYEPVREAHFTQIRDRVK